MKKLSLLGLTMVTLLLARCEQTTQNPSGSGMPSQSNETAQSVAPTIPPENETSEDEAQTHDGSSVVYMTTDISSEGLQAVYDALQWSPTGNLATKVSTGEPPNSNYLRQELIGELVTSLDGTYVECNTAYGGSRAETAMHYQVAEDHGFEPMDIMDEDDSMELSVNNGEVLDGVNYVGANFSNYNSMLVLSHFKGHQMAGFGGAIKNISIGIASSMGKVWIHSGGEQTSGSIMGDTDKFQMAMAEAGQGICCPNIGWLLTRDFLYYDYFIDCICCQLL